MTRVIFVLSSFHSGSTWIGYVLGSTPRSAFVGEFHRAWNPEFRVPCTLCATRGLPTCTALHGIEDSRVGDAFTVAAARTGKQVLIDSSKLLDWAKPFVGRPDLDCRFVHVIRDPRGWYASARRRGAVDLPTMLASWCAENRAFRNFARAAGSHGVTICYDQLAVSPQRSFQRLFSFCGLPYDASALRYWKTEHHGFAANGASAALIREAGAVTPPSHFATGDDAFYHRHTQHQFYDNRWRAALNADERATIEHDAAVRDLLASLGYRLTRTGIRRRFRHFIDMRARLSWSGPAGWPARASPDSSPVSR